MTKISKKCLECGVKFYKKPSESKRYWTTKKYCSPKCSLIYTSLKAKGVMESFPIGHIPWNKNIKGKQSWMNISGLEKGRGYFKGKKRPDMQGENSPFWKPKVFKFCKICKKEMILPPWKKSYKFCGRTCWALGRRGKNNPLYKGKEAITRLKNRTMELPEYKQWHAIILKRDSYKCIWCSSNKNLEVDHIKRFLFIIKDNKVKTIEDARNCVELWDTKNGRTLCRICHHTTDTYGTTGLKSV